MFNIKYINQAIMLNNLNILKSANPTAKLTAMVKAGAYGMGLPAVVKSLSGKVEYFGVSNIKEAFVVRSLTNTSVLIVTPLDIQGINTYIKGKHLNESNIQKAFDKLNFSFTCADLTELKFLAGLGIRLNIHIKINTGMNRFGFSSVLGFKKALKLIKNSPLVLEGLFTHFATADDAYVEYQFNRFKTFITLAQLKGFTPITHADNSANYNKHKLDMIRVGFNLYNKSGQGFMPVMEISARVLQVNRVKAGQLVGYDYRYRARKTTRVAVISVGYADGFSLNYLGLNLNIMGRACKVINICMDCFMIEVGNLKIKKGDSVFILNQLNPLSLYADYAKISCYEVATRFANLRATTKLVSIPT